MKRRNFLKMFGLALPAIAVTSQIAKAIPDVPSDPILAPDVTSGISAPPEAMIPEVWAKESLHVLDKNIVAGNLIHRDFEFRQAQTYSFTGDFRIAFIQEKSVDSYVILFKDSHIVARDGRIIMRLFQEENIPNVSVYNLIKSTKKLIIGGDTICVGIPEFMYTDMDWNTRNMEYKIQGYAPRVDVL